MSEHDETTYVAATEPVALDKRPSSEGRTAAIIVAVLLSAIVLLGFVLMIAS